MNHPIRQSPSAPSAPAAVRSALAARIFIAAAALLIGAAAVPPVTAPATAAPATATPAPAAAQKSAATDSPTTAADAAISKVLDEVVKANNLPGMAAAVIVDGKIAGVGVAGIRKKPMPPMQVTPPAKPEPPSDGPPVPVLRDDPFHLGSCTKAMTATLIGILVDEGKLKWDSTIADLIGRDIGGLNPDYATVTIDQLLHHRSGSWPNGPSEVWQAAQRAKGTPAEQRQRYVEAILSRPPRFAPGKYLYSNAGYAILGFIAETVTGTPYEKLMEEKIFLPLGLKSAGFGNAGGEKEVTAPYPHMETGLPNFLDNPEAITSAGRIHMNMADWAKFCLVHLGHQPTPPLLKPETLEHLHTLAGEVAEDQSGYACGWMRPEREWAGGRTLHHGGSNMLNWCVVWLAPAKDFGVLVATNQGGAQAQAAVDQAAGGLISQFLPPSKK